MAQRSAQDVLQKREKPFLTYKWMRHFFTEDVLDHNRSIIELQQRAVWIALAIFLQSLNEIDHNWYFPFIKPFGSLIPFALILGSFYALWRALRPAKEPSSQPAHSLSSVKDQKGPKLWQRIVLVLTLVLTIAGAINLGWGVVLSFLPARFSNDGTSLDTNAAILLVEGHNPYTDSNIPDLLRRFDNIHPEWTTPLRRGQFAGRLDYPSMAEIQSILNTSLKANDVPEFEARVSYPALSFLTLVPFVLIQDYNVLPFYLLSYLLLVFIAWKVARPELRPWVLLLSLANVPMWSSTVGGNLDVFYTLLVVLAWLKRDQRWTSAVFFGLAMASKQIAWYFMPFYIIMTLRHYGWKEALYRSVISGGLALAINLPFIVWNYHTWLAGVMAPVADPMFPMGVGLVGLSVTHLIPYLPERIYSLLEYGAMLLSLIWYWRICLKRPEAALLLAIMPLFLAWRSLSSYFYCVAFPLYVVLAAQKNPSLVRVFSFLHLSKAKDKGSVPSVVGG
ncbi:MAG: DUF2029 domain-containing protein [Ktedonobacteraceae bacterium]|nr:DUF2029 domain-containing protein [Ktedonobacteraceae bacterium]